MLTLCQTRVSVNHVIFIILLIGISFSDSTQLSFTEGGQAELLYHYNQKQDLDVEIRIGDRPPFYQHGVMLEAGLSTNHNQRFSVDIEKHTALGVSYQMFRVRVKIENVSREDAGTYKCLVYQNGHINEEETKKVVLNIEFPPGKANCVLGPNQIDTSSGVWSPLKCTASIGSRQGLIECYQNGKRMPLWTRPTQNRTNLVQVIRIRKTIPIFCCSSTYDRVSDMCSCQDFIRDFSQGNDAIPGLHPCQSSTESPKKLLSTESIQEMGTHVEGSPTNSATTPDQPDKLNPSFADTSESGLVLSIVLVFTVLNTFGIAIMITISTVKNNIIKSFKKLLCNREERTNDKQELEKINTESPRDENDNE